MDETYYQALAFCQQSTREDGIDAALANNGKKLDALLVPPDVGQTYQIAAQAGYPMLTVPAGTHTETGMPFGLALMVSAWEEDKLVKWGSAIEDLMAVKGEGRFGRTKPKWYSYTKRNVPVLNL
jgi:amidase